MSGIKTMRVDKLIDMLVDCPVTDKIIFRQDDRLLGLKCEVESCDDKIWKGFTIITIK